MNSVSKDLLSSVVYSSNARQVWIDLQERFDQPHDIRVFHLLRHIYTLMQGSTRITQYFPKLHYLWDQLSSIIESPTCSCEKSKKYVEYMQHQKLYQFLIGLNELYSQVHSQILLMSLLPSINQAYSMLLQESHRAMLSCETTLDSTTLIVQRTWKNRNVNIVCEYCHLKGHEKNCYKLNGYC